MSSRASAPAGCCSTADRASSPSCASAKGGWPQLDSIVISHWHLDHWGDLVPWVWGRMFGLGHESDAPEVWVPPGGIDQLEMFGELFGTPSMFADVFPLREYAEREPFETAAGLTLSAFRSRTT